MTVHLNSYNIAVGVFYFARQNCCSEDSRSGQQISSRAEDMIYVSYQIKNIERRTRLLAFELFVTDYSELIL